jgi:hypothetical protein
LYWHSEVNAPTLNSQIEITATRCFGEDAINLAVGGAAGVSQNGNIFSSFAREGQNPIVYSYCAHKNP